MIQESMSKGDFNNIRPSGKPLHERNPHYMDFTTYKINEILIDNGKIDVRTDLRPFRLCSGYMPDWIVLEKEVRQSVDQARIDLKRIFKAIATEHSSTTATIDEHKTYLANHPKWLQAIEKFQSDIAAVNVSINKLNLIVPMLWRQQVTRSPFLSSEVREGDRIGFSLGALQRGEGDLQDRRSGSVQTRIATE